MIKTIHTKILVLAWILELAGLIYAIVIPVGQASVWVLLLTAIIGFPIIIHFIVSAIQLGSEVRE